MEEWKPLDIEKAHEEAKKLRKLILTTEEYETGDQEAIHKITAEQYDRANTLLDQRRAAKLGKEAEELRKRFQEIKKFVVTPEAWQKALTYFQFRKNDLIQIAGLARDRGVSHRDPPFQVGCVALGIEPSAKKPKYGIYEAYNFKIKPGLRSGKDKKCAERNALDIARDYSKVVAALVTVSRETNTGDPSKSYGRTLHPCLDCRMMYRQLLQSGFIREDTMICITNDANHEMVTEEMTVRQLLSMYRDDLA